MVHHSDDLHDEYDDKDLRTAIYARNKLKALQMARGMDMSVQEMVNFFIETFKQADVQKISQITLRDEKTKKTLTIRSVSRKNFVTE